MRACVRACAFAIKPLDFCQLLSMGLCKINKLALAVIEVLLHVGVPVFVVRVPVQCVCAFACVCWHVCVPVFVVRVPVQCVHFYPSHHVGKSCGSTKIEGLDKAAH
jgi:hypothetical protein